MGSPSERDRAYDADHVRTIVGIARDLLDDIDEELAGPGEGRAPADLPGYPAGYGTGRVLFKLSMLSLHTNLLDDWAATGADGRVDDVRVGVDWLRNIVRELSDRWLDGPGDRPPFWFVALFIGWREEGLPEGQGLPVIPDVLAVRETDRRPRDEALEGLGRWMLARWKEDGPAMHLGCVVVPAAAGDLEKLTAVTKRFREEGEAEGANGWCASPLRFKRPLTVDPAQREALRGAVELLTSALADGDGEALPPAILIPATDPENARPHFFQRMGFLDADGLARLEEGCRQLDARPDLSSAFNMHLLKRTHGVGKEGRNPSPREVGEILGRAREFVRAVEACLPVEDDPDCNAALHEFPWLDGEFYVCRAASDLFDAMLGEGGELGPGGAANAYGWDFETNLGLRWLNAQVGALLGKWRVYDWERRLRTAGLEPEFRVTISRGEIKALGRAVDCVERGLARDAEAGAGPNPGEEPGTSSCGEPGSGAVGGGSAPYGLDANPAGPPGPAHGSVSASKRAQIIGAFYESQGAATNAEIAEQAGANEGYVSRVLRPIRERFRAMYRGGMPDGRKGHDGSIEAWPA